MFDVILVSNWKTLKAGHKKQPHPYVHTMSAQFGRFHADNCGSKNHPAFLEKSFFRNHSESVWYPQNMVYNRGGLAITDEHSEKFQAALDFPPPYF